MKSKPLSLPTKVMPGYKRFYYRCTCKQIQCHEVIPFGLGQGIRWNSCLCQLTGQGTHLLTRISRREATTKSLSDEEAQR